MSRQWKQGSATAEPGLCAASHDPHIEFPQDPNMPVDIEVYCTNGVKPLYASNVVPAKMLCSYQNPHCIGFPSSIQC